MHQLFALLGPRLICTMIRHEEVCTFVHILLGLVCGFAPRHVYLFMVEIGVSLNAVTYIQATVSSSR